MFFDFAQVRTVLLLRVQLVQLRLARQLVVMVLPERQVAVSRLVARWRWLLATTGVVTGVGVVTGAGGVALLEPVLVQVLLPGFGVATFGCCGGDRHGHRPVLAGVTGTAAGACVYAGAGVDAGCGAAVTVLVFLVSGMIGVASATALVINNDSAVCRLNHTRKVRTTPFVDTRFDDTSCFFV